MTFFTNKCELARQNAMSSLKVGTRLPERTVDKAWEIVLFFDLDPADGSFVQILRQLIEVEGSSVCYMADPNIDGSSGEADGFCFEPTMTEREYGLEWNKGVPYPKINMMRDHTCASDKGEWFMYVERVEDVGFIAFKNQEQKDKYKAPIHLLEADNIRTLIGVVSGRAPFNRFVDRWKTGLVKNYD